MEKELSKLFNLRTFDDIIAWVEGNPDAIFERVRGLISRYKDVGVVRENFKVQITYLDVIFSERLSNTHSAPCGKQTNLGRAPGKPVGYPGWGGRIEFSITPNCGISGSDVGRAIRMNTGTGGGAGNGYYGYDVKIFEEDWPGMGETIVMLKLADQLPGKFSYGTPRYFSS